MTTNHDPYIHYPTDDDRDAVAELIARFGGDATALVREAARQGHVAVATLDRHDIGRYLAEHDVPLTDTVWREVFEPHVEDYDEFVDNAGTDTEFVRKLMTGEIDGHIDPGDYVEMPAGLHHLRGALTGDFTAERINEVFGLIRQHTGLSFGCLWTEHDDGFTGTPTLVSPSPHGHLWHMGRRLEAWLTRDPSTPDSPDSPGVARDWRSSNFAKAEHLLAFHDDAHNYALTVAG